MNAHDIADTLQLDRFFDEKKMVFDLVGGLVWNPAKSRMILLSTDLLTGVYQGLLDEAGQAWKIIFKNCGAIWGERVAKRLDRECQLLIQRRVGELPLGQYLEFMREYFVFHGWGRLELDVSHALETGIVEATLRDSIFAQIVTDSEDMADPMIAGILAAMLSYLSGQKLDCLQTACVTKGADCSRFLITGAARLTDAEQRVASGSLHEELLATI